MTEPPRTDIPMRGVLIGLALFLPMWMLLFALARLIDWGALPLGFVVPIAAAFAIAGAGIVAWMET